MNSLIKMNRIQNKVKISLIKIMKLNVVVLDAMFIFNLLIIKSMVILNKKYLINPYNKINN